MCFVLFFTIYIESNGQYITPIGSRLNGMGGAAVSVSDAFSVFSNPATLTGLEKTTIGTYFDHRYNVSGLNTSAFAYSQVIKNTRLATGLTRYGDDLLNQSRIEIAVAHKIRMVSLGGGISYHQLTISENGTGRNVLFQFGGMAEITPKIKYGASVYNIFRSKIAKDNPMYYPVIMRMGISYLPIKPVIISAEVEKQSFLDANFKAGLEYKPFNFLSVRTGINNSPSNGYFGVGFKLKEWNLDYALNFHNRLGLVHFISLSLSFGAKELVEVEKKN